MNKNIYNNLKMYLAISLSVTTLHSYELKPVGLKATGMGGTGVANTRGSLASYYNPALLRFSDYTTDIELNAGLKVREANLLQPINELTNIDFSGTLERIGNNAGTGKKKLVINGIVITNTLLAGTSNKDKDKNNIKDAIDIITKRIGAKNALQVSAIPSFTAQISDAIAIGVYRNIDANFRININSDYDKMIVKTTETINSQTLDIYYSYDYDTDEYIGTTDDKDYKTKSLEYATNNGINYILVDTAILLETPISYARMYDFKSGTYSFGASIKPMTLTSSKTKLKIGESLSDANDKRNDLETTYDSTFGLDLGIAYKPNNSKLTLGIVGKNLNSPTFKVNKTTTNEKDYKIDPYLRAGLSVPIWNDNIEFALDLDLQKNDTIISGEKTQFVGTGIELHPSSSFALRAGAMKDLASQNFDDGTILTAGVGFGLKWLQFDISAMLGTNKSEFKGQEIPKYFAVNLALVSRWGDGYNRKQAPITNEKNIKKEKIMSIKEKSDKAQLELEKGTKETTEDKNSEN
ncbi:predicted secreted protein [hydrothermal vent metagenome]|uniref:Predicted secreted protein n=1 Tax=hydrothermal vent metagenome TaxID=652676 RepID=A0A3B1DWS2_9ZZZZ